VDISPDPSGRWSAEQQEVLYWAGIAESASEHPLARAVTRAAETAANAVASGMPAAGLPMPDHFTAFPGKGIRAETAGRVVLVGSPEWIEAQGVEIPAGAGEDVRRQREDGKTVVMTAVDGAALGLLAISDRMREGVAEVIANLRRDGIKEIIMLTGDDAQTARAVAREAGISDVRANLLPDDKLNAIRELQRQGRVVAMVGDGINDAPALAAADLGIAMGAAGSGVAIETADVALMSDDLSKVQEAIHISRATVSNIHQNLVVALITVTLLMAGVLLDQVHMAGGMLVHQASVLVVIFNGMRLLKK
jgi:Cd2+/Zn2+-exporting ATPase